MEQFNLTFPQKNIYMVDMLNSDTALNTIAGVFKINKNFSSNICISIIRELIRANDAMRTKIIDGDEPKQCFESYTNPKIDEINMNGKSKKEVDKLLNSLTSEPIDIRKDSLVNFSVITTSESTGMIYLKLHHIVGDAWTLMLIINQLAEMYNKKLNKENIELTVPSYKEYIASEQEYLNSEKYLKDEEFWKEYMEGISEPVSLKEKVSKVTTKAARYSVTLSKEENDAIMKFAKENRVSPYTMFLAALANYVYRIKDVNEVVIGTPILNRSNFKEKNMLGCFISTIPMRIKITENMKFLDLVKEIGSQTMSLFRHQKYPITKTIEHVHNTSEVKGKIYNMMLSYQNARANVKEEDGMSTNWIFSGHIQDDLEIHVMDMDSTGLLTINYDYLTDLFESIEIEYLHTRLMALIMDAIANVDISVEDIRIMSKEEENKILYEFNDTDMDYPKDKTVIELFEEQVEKTPNNIALVFEDKQMTYKELNEKANSLAHYLKEEKGVKPNDVVALVLNRSFEVMIGILGTLKAGATYLPIDPNFPNERIQYMLENSNAKVQLYNGFYKDIQNSNINNIKIINSIEDIAYILYTSGSTGKPKGVMVKYLGLNNICNYFYQHEVYKNVDNVVSITTISFDIFVFDTITSLINGKKIIIANEEEQSNPLKLKELILKYNIDLLQATPTRIKMMYDYIKDELGCISKIVLSGEKLTYELKNMLICNGTKKIYNGYGPTENTVFSSFTNCTDENKISIGRAINNTKFYVFDSKKRIMPLGIEGELFVSGFNIAKGYINNKKLTEESFILLNNKKIYKTGDICEIGYDLKTYCIGRIDHQVKLNGIRVELDEISKTLCNISGIKEAIVINKSINNKTFLVAYYVGQQNFDEPEIKLELEKKLPLYMIPNKIIKLDEFPMTPNQKIDRKKIESLEINFTENNKIEEFNEIQLEIFNSIKKILHISQMSLTENFYSIGLDSLNMIKLFVDLQNKFDISISIKDFNECSTILDVEDLIKNSNVDYIKLNIPLKKEKYELSPSQFGIFTNYSMNTESKMYNIPFELTISKNIDIIKLIEAIKSTIELNDVFYTKLNIIDGIVYQIIDKNLQLDKLLKIKKVNKIEYENSKEDYIKVFDLLNDYLFDIKIFELENQYKVLFNIHHIIFDGLSIEIILNEIKGFYENSVIKNKEYVFGQFIALEKQQENSDKYKKAKEFFVNKFNDELPDNNMILDKKRNKHRKYNGNRITLKISKKDSDKIKEYSKINNVTLNSIFLAMFNLTLSKYMYSDDIIVGLATSGRTIKEQMNQIGMFVKTIPFRTKINPEINVLEYIKNIQNNVLESVENSIYPYDALVKELNISRDPSRNPLFDIMFVYQNTGMPIYDINKTQIKINNIYTNTSKFDMSCEVMPNDEEFDINIEYDSDIYMKHSIKRLVQHYINCILSAIEQEKKLKDVEILSEKQKKSILKDVNNTKTEYPSDKTISQLFSKQVQLTPNNIAVVFENKKLTYIELENYSNQVANYLIELGVKPKDRVAFIMDKSLEMICSIVAILKIGAIYVPLEKDFPNARIEYIIKDADIKYVLINDQSEYVNNKNILINLSNLNNYDIKSIDINMNSESIAYLMYTSGTTGNPKGVMVTNRNVIRLVKNTNYIDFFKDDVMIQTGAISFDASTFEIWGALLNGITLHLVKKEELLNLNKLEEYIKDNKVTIMWLTSKLMNNVVEYKIELFEKIRVLLAGGDTLSIKHINMIKKKYPNIKIINGYGPTENTTFSSCQEIKKIYNQSIPIGKPISNSTCYIVDKYGKLCYKNMPGELIVGGDGVSKGYLNRPELSNQKFCNYQVESNKVERIYKTGDLTYFNKEFEIEFLGRIDTQVKIRGFRIEPEEINQRLIQYNKVKEAVVTVEIHENKKVIVAYYTSLNDIYREELVKYLKEYLPQYMIPKYFIRLPKLPLNNNGKADKNKLIEISNQYIEELKKNNYEEISYTGEYFNVYELFREVLEIENIGMDDNFFDIGGDSLLALKLVTNAISKNIKITYSDLFKYPTIRELGGMLNKTINKDSISKEMDSFDYTAIDEVLSRNKIFGNEKLQEKIGNILLTGVTGFLGAHILDEYFTSEKGKIYCLVRGKNGKTADLRLKESLKFFFGNKYDNEIGKRIFIIEGDILELDNFDIKSEYLNDIDVVINSAACVKHFGDYEKFYRINTEIVKELIEFCLKNKKQMIQISTLSVSGNLLEAGQLEQQNVKNGTVFNETNLYINQNLDNVYAYTKYLAEKYIYDAIANKGLDAKIMRMGNLTGRTKDGKFQPNVTENAFANRLKTMLELNVLPENMLDFYLEFTPIDFAAKAVILLTKIKTNANTFHLFNHNHALLNYVDKVLKYKLDINLKHISKEDMTKIIEEYSKQENGFEKIQGILMDVNNNKELDYTSNIKVCSEYTINILKEFGFEWPIVEQEYIAKYIGYLYDIGFIKKEG